MYYCFLVEDIAELINDPLIIQKEYANRLGCLCIGSLANQSFYSPSGSPMSIEGKEILLRCTYDNLHPALQLLKKGGALLVESEEDIERIEAWPELGLTSRELCEVSLSNLLLSPLEHLVDKQYVFLKSKHKGYSAVIRASRIIQHDPEVVSFLGKQSAKYGEPVILSNYFSMKTDSIGVRETRHVIWQHEVINSSRFLHSVKHTVPRSHKIKAQEIARQIKELGSFPDNYILDLGEFMAADGSMYLDIIELNPMSCSMCFVNNSIFYTAIPEIGDCQQQLMMGHEFCYDALANPQRYILMRSSNKSYSYTSEERYSFL